ncbi:hypothetical protein MmiEs2_01330 [Methanimicrococcus stummii]|uniref:N-acetyltransferase domain-containing protein n=1 Tax=Methanimicrococcus stummii TaxID=3028294 RepID=A0AA96V764_9EURY|nr:N-acetyltransferase [Methanimicrococcus sp. Es2]WNY27954.1 hypothetical protein MmiEs2_01330 [Methanimicrococcus sp. Es2]
MYPEISIRETVSEDFQTIMEIHETAFGHDKEAKLTAALLNDKSAAPVVSLIAFEEETAVGHILFTRASFENGANLMMHILAPLAVVPSSQKKGVGESLIRSGLQKLQELDSELVFVLGHKEYYPKFGFEPCAEKAGYPAPYPIPEIHQEYWMMQSVSKSGKPYLKGKIKCADALDKPEHWRE